MEVYKLQSGAEILFEGIDEEEPIEVGSELMQPGSIKYATWVMDKNIFKPKDKRRFTAIYNLKSGGKIKGRISVTNHYTVNAKSITMRSPAIWETSYESPLKVSTHKDAYKSKRTKLTKAGQQFYAGAQFYVTTSKKITTSSTTTAGADLGISISQSSGTSITWEKNVKSLHKIYAIVTLNKFAKGGAYMKHSGKVAFAY